MQTRTRTRMLVIAIAIVGCTVPPPITHAQWYGGTWDSRYNPLLDHPWTVAIRMEMLDRDTHIPVSGVQVSLEGQYYQMWINRDTAIAQDVPWWNLFVDPNKREPQPREFRLNAVSGPDGVVVFSLQWQKEFPWDSYFDGHPPRDYQPDGSWTQKDSWLLAVDDIEKVQWLEIRHPRYRYVEAPLNFQHVVNLEQYLRPQGPIRDKYKLFEQNWKNEIRRPNVKMVVLDLGTDFPEFKKQSCTRPEFFSRIRAKDYGEIYQGLENLPQWDEGKKCGPYFVYDLGEILLEPVAGRLEVQGPSASILTQDAQGQGAPWYRQYSRQSDGADARSAEDTRQPQATPAAPTGRQTMEPSAQPLPSVQDILKDPARLRDLAGKAGVLKDQLAVAGIRALPFPDPDTGQMTTFDSYARKIASDAGVGGSLGEDPVATAYAMLFDSNFLTDQARIIQLPDGTYGTLNEAINAAAADSNSGLDPEALGGAVAALGDLRQAQRTGQEDLAGKAARTFAGAVPIAASPTRNVPADSTIAGPVALPDQATSEGGVPQPRVWPQRSQDEYAEIAKNDPLGIALETVTTAELQDRWAFPETLGRMLLVHGSVIVRYVSPGSPADKAGLTEGCVIRTMEQNQLLIRSAADYQKLLGYERIKNSQTIEVTCWQLPVTYRYRQSDDLYAYHKTFVIEKDSPSSVDYSPTRTVDLGNGVSMEFVLIPAGTFKMGSPGSEAGRDDDEGPVRRVQITRPFYLGKYEVTQDQYMAAMGTNPSHFSGRSLPAETVSWDQAAAFCRKVGGRLPTEAEWEYACRAGSSGRFCFGDSDSGLGDYAWHTSNSGSTTHAIGQKRPNAFGLYDMHGNVWEWCQDWYAKGYQNASGVDPKGPSSGEYRVVRGGGWDSTPRRCRSAIRGYNAPDIRDINLGFRVALDSN